MNDQGPRDATYIAVVGAGDPHPDTDGAAFEVGRALGERGAVLVCGGMTGVMESACRGAKAAGGTTVGILPTSHRRHANAFVDIAIATGMGEMRNALIVRAVDAVIAVGGEFGTLSEIALALKIGVPVVGLQTWGLTKAAGPVDAIVTADSADEAVERALQAAQARPSTAR
jgi:uncharacterized protein (TIGR00725 family)